jgi:outer membrane receptor for ferrienterochelin and colicins
MLVTRNTIHPYAALVGRMLATTALMICIPGLVRAQAAWTSLTVRVLLDGQPVEAAQVWSTATSGITNASGEVILRLPAGRHTVRVQKIGIQTTEQTVTLQQAADTLIPIVVREAAVEREAIIVSSTRAERRIEDEPLRVEVVPREEVEEKLLMTPGDIAMLLNETAGLRVQPTAPALGGASVRIQGLRGRYTQILSDGLPLFGAQTGALGPLQIPPMDLGQVEVIKGVASALYGSSALGGVVNLLSRRPAEEPERELLLNQSTLGGTDAILWTSQRLNDSWGYTLLASGHRQSAADVDDDGWADVPWFRRAVVRPRAFWTSERGASVLFTVGGMLEDRQGGMIDGRVTPAGTPHRENLETRRVDSGIVARALIGDSRLLSVRGSGTLQRHDHGYGDNRERDRHATGFMEVALSGTVGKHNWVIGAALQHEHYRAHDVAAFDYAFTIPGVFVQNEYVAAEWLTLSGSARFDHHTAYGSFVNPRLSFLLRPAEGWTLRASGGTGYFAPTPWIEETEAVGLSRLSQWSGLAAERARSVSFDVGRAFGAFELNATVFGSGIHDAVQARHDPEDATKLELFNAAAPVRTHGTELLARYHREGVHVTVTHVFIKSTEPDPETGARRNVPLTPRHAIGIVAALEQEERGRLAAEFYYTGRQELEENPYRAVSPHQFVVGVLAERYFGRARVFLNAENVLDTRQTRRDPLLLPARAPEGRWITDVWGLLEGRSFNGGIRWFF